jgi:hypothetical protein
MKFPILCLPIILQALFIVALYTRQPPATVSLTPAQRDAERRELRQERNTINERLQTLEIPTEFVPRGIGKYAMTLPSTVSPATDVRTLAFFRSTPFNFPDDGYYNMNQSTRHTNYFDIWAVAPIGSITEHATKGGSNA